MSRFVKGKTATLTLANGDTLVIKHRLNKGEELEMYRRMGADSTRIAFCTVIAHLLDWTLKDEQHPIYGLSDEDKEKVLNNLDPDDFDEIKTAIYAHVTNLQKERDEAKKAARGETASSATLPSADSTAGPTTPSTNLTQTSTS